MSLFEDLGGEEAIGRLVDAFYRHMETDPTVLPLLAVHPDLPRARERLFEFLVGWTGGPPLYVQKHGHPRLRARHLHVAIDESMAMMWLYCMEHALRETVASEALREVLRGNLSALAHHMRNQEG
jgi:hemoglobin